MNVEVFTGVAPNFERLVTVDFHCGKCGTKHRIPVQHLIDRVADKIEDYYCKQNEYIIAENKKLRDIIEFGNQVQLIKEMAKRL